MSKIKIDFKNATYNIIPSTNPDFVECIVSYKCNGKQENHFIFLEKNEKFTNKDYIREAKKQFKKDYQRGELDLDIKSKSKKPLLITAGVIACTAIVTFATLWGLNLNNGGNPIYEETCLVNFDTDNGSYIPAVVVKKGKPVAEPENDPIKEGYTFKEWRLNDKTYVFTDPVNDDITLKAIYTKNGSEPESFITDTWDVFLEEIDGKTYDEIAGINSPYHDEWLTNNTFVGLSRNIEIEDEIGTKKVYNAIVIDESKTAEASDNKFTFLITDLDTSMNFGIASNFYPNSSLDLYLHSVLNGFPTIVKKHVCSTTIDCYNTDPIVKSIVQYTTSIYIPSASQIFGEGAYKTENSRFKYFENSGSITTMSNGWLRTPKDTTQGKTYFINSAGELHSGLIEAQYKVMPVFIIK